MTLADVQTKKCGACGKWKPADAEHFYAKGGPGKWDTYCRPCRRARTKKRAKDPAYRESRTAATMRWRAKHPETVREANVRRWERIKADDERHAAVLAARRDWEAERREDPVLGTILAQDARMAKLIRENRPSTRRNRRSRGHWTKNLSPEEYVDPIPFLKWLDSTWPDKTVMEIVALLPISERKLRFLIEGQDHVAITTIDRVLTGIGRPDLLNLLYPLED
jgi:hypothetical protein